MSRVIVQYPDDVLRKVCAEVGEIDDVMAGIGIELLEVLHSKEHHLGLAAPQLGYPWRMFVLRPYPQPFINPVVIEVGRATDTKTEQCLSIPWAHVAVERPTYVLLEATSLLGVRKKWKMRGKDARAALHEFDHLDGKLIIDYSDAAA